MKISCKRDEMAALREAFAARVRPTEGRRAAQTTEGMSPVLKKIGDQDCCAVKQCIGHAIETRFNTYCSTSTQGIGERVEKL